jgi:hypothetical protein
MYYLLSLITFIFYYIGINIFEAINIKLNKYKQLFQYKIIYEQHDYQILEPLYFALFLLPVFIQNLIMLFIIVYIIKDLLDFYLKEKKSKNLVIIKTYKTIFGIMITINTIYNYNDYIITSIINIISLCLLFNDYQVKICNSFTNS